MTRKHIAACSVKWCVCLVAKRDGTLCAAHLKTESLHPALPDGQTTALAVKPSDCSDCGGSGECEDCEGEGTHYCGHGSCDDEHDCRACDGTGACRSCRPRGKQKELSADERYLQWAMRRYPWSEAPTGPEWPWDATA